MGNRLAVEDNLVEGIPEEGHQGGVVDVLEVVAAGIQTMSKETGCHRLRFPQTLHLMNF